MVGRLPWNFPNDVAYDISLHHYMMTQDDTLIVGNYHDDMDVLHDLMMMKKPNNGEAILSQTFLMLSQTFYAQNLRTVTKKNYFCHIRGIFSQWDLDHLKEYFFLFLMSPYLPRNS